MVLADRTQLLTTLAEVDAFLAAHPTSAIFKMGVCHKTAETFRHVEKHLGPREDLRLGMIRVIESRPASNHVASLTGIRHESPQLILWKDGKVAFEFNNWDITDEDLGAAMDEHFEAVAR